MVLAARTAGEPSGEPSSVGIDLPRPLAKSSGTSLSGNVAEWIVEDPSTIPDNKLYPFPNYGSTFFTGCAAGTKSFELNLSRQGD
jgi:Peptidase A4 family